MGKNVVITGGSGGLGKSVIDRFVKDGYQVLATVSAGKKSGLENTSGVEAFAADLTNEQSASSAVASMIDKYSSIDAAVLLVGGYAPGSIMNTDGASMRKMYSLNFETVWFIVRPVFLQMMKQADGGRIILVGSRPSLKPADGKKSLAYSLSKSLLFRLAEILNEEGASKNVVTTVVVPSTIDTDVNRKSMPDADFNSWVKPEDIAAIMAFAADAKNILRESVLKVYGKA